MVGHTTSLLALIGLPGWAELLVVAFVGLLLFGKRLPEVARSLGQSIVEFKQGMAGVKDEIKNAGDTPRPQNTVAQSQSPQALPDSNAPRQTEAPKTHTVESTE